MNWSIPIPPIYSEESKEPKNLLFIGERTAIHSGKLGDIIYAIKNKGKFPNVYGVEISPGAIKIAKEVLGLKVYSDLETLTDYNLQFDFVYLKHNLEHQREPMILVEKLSKLVAPGGYLLIGVPNRRSINGLWGKRWEWMTPPIHIHFFSRGSLYHVLNKNHFSVFREFTQRGHGLPLLKHAIFFTPVIGQVARKLLGGPSEGDVSSWNNRRKIFETIVLVSTRFTTRISQWIKLHLGIGEELWMLSKRKRLEAR